MADQLSQDHEDKYRVIVADAPWKYSNYGMKKHGAARAHYAGMTESELAEVEPARWADPSGSILAMWATWPKLDEAIRLMAAWDYRYVTGIPWVKTLPRKGVIRRGVGFWTMSCSEPLLIGRRGTIVRGRHLANIGLLTKVDRQFYAPRAQHSRKPAGVQAWLESMFDGPYLELFATERRERWTCWGKSLGQELGAFGVREVQTC